MNNLPRQIIQELLTKQGYTLLDNHRQIEAILQDTCKDCKTEVFVLISALKEQIPRALLLHSQSNVPIQLKLDQLTKQLQENRGLAKEPAQWAVESWALSLGLISTDQVKYHSSASPRIDVDHPTEVKRDSTLQPQYAGIDRRFLASLLDALIMFIPSILISYIVQAMYVELLTTEEASTAADFLVGIIVQWIYCALQESSAKQATLGKQALGIVVTDLNGRRISFRKATNRHFAKWLSALSLVGYLLPLFIEKKQALHDMLAGCLVVRK